MTLMERQSESGSLEAVTSCGVNGKGPLATNSRINSRVKDFTLNMDKTLLKQLEATKKGYSC